MAESIFRQTLAKTPIPAIAWEPVAACYDELDEKIREHNKRVISIQQTKAATDTNNVDLLDDMWRNSTIQDVIEKRVKFEEVSEQYEKMIAELRALAKAEIKPPLSDEELEKAKKLANEDAKLIDEMRVKAEQFGIMADQFLSMSDTSIEGGFISLLPEVKSTKNARGGRKATAPGETRQYRTRIDSVEIDGKLVESVTTKRDGTEVRKSNLIIAAEELCRKWNAAKLPQNGVTDEELERAMYDAHNVEFRDSSSLPIDVEFTFKKEVAVQSHNDNSVKAEPQQVQILVHRSVRAKAETETETETKSKEVKAETQNSIPEVSKPEAEAAKSNEGSTPKLGTRTQEMLARKNAANKK